MTGRPNILFLMSDEHARRVMGVYGDPVVQTPNLDRLAAQSLVFDAAYTPSPICVPARAALATGRDIHETGHWDNAHPYEGKPISWAQCLRDAGFKVESFGKLHYRDSVLDTGFSDQRLPMHVANGVGDLTGSVRTPPPLRRGSRRLAEQLGPGETDYTRYDRAVRDAAVNRLYEAADRDEDGLILFVSFVAPHFPLVAPEEFFKLYENLPLQPHATTPEASALHPWLEALRNSYAYDNFDEKRRQTALQSYYGLVSFLDNNIGQILDGLVATGRQDRTSVVYLSDHGDNLGERGMWGKSTFFEDSVGVPLMIQTAGQRFQKRCRTPVSLIDIFPTMLDLAGLDETGQEQHRVSLLRISEQGFSGRRSVLSQYHAAGSPSGAFMIRRGDFKYIRYEGFEPQLFNMRDDPRETRDLASYEAHKQTLDAMDAELLRRLDPTRANAQALDAQSALLDRYGGEESILAKGGEFSATPVENTA